MLETFSFNFPKNISEEGKWLLAVSSFEATNTFFMKLMKTVVLHFHHQDNGIAGRGDEVFNKLNELLELRSQNDIELLVEEVKKRVT